ncbi:MAG TPA: hypothetical protein EYQ27_08005 [Gemmatimonadetes bacterium]|nr:hypothetical protein [Gemmatimonadota bacterium]
MPERGLNAILALSCTTLFAGMVGALLDLYRLAATLTVPPELAQSLAPVWLVRDATLLAVSMMIALSGAIGWFTLREWLAFAKRAQREVLGMDDTTINSGSSSTAWPAPAPNPLLFFHGSRGLAGGSKAPPDSARQVAGAEVIRPRNVRTGAAIRAQQHRARGGSE